MLLREGFHLVQLTVGNGSHNRAFDARISIAHYQERTIESRLDNVDGGVERKIYAAG